ncbi:MAG TPA: hypothetical protein VFU23_05525, partial [Gemmatimonadales bacterium]|nr:hypothetical protein [Gemmatimonadales bacterium]
TAPFAQHRTALGRFLVGSTAMRVGYTVAKTTTFCGLALALALGGPAGLSGVLRVTAWTAVALCLLRGLPVIMHAAREFYGAGFRGSSAGFT